MVTESKTAKGRGLRLFTAPDSVPGRIPRKKPRNLELGRMARYLSTPDIFFSGAMLIEACVHAHHAPNGFRTWIFQQKGCDAALTDPGKPIHGTRTSSWCHQSKSPVARYLFIAAGVFLHVWKVLDYGGYHKHPINRLQRLRHVGKIPRVGTVDETRLQCIQSEPTMLIISINYYYTRQSCQLQQSSSMC